MWVTTMERYSGWVHMRTLILAPPCGKGDECAAREKSEWSLCVDGLRVCDARVVRRLVEAARGVPATYHEGFPHDHQVVMGRVCEIGKYFCTVNLCADGTLMVQKDNPSEYVAIPAAQIARWLDEHVAAWDCAE